MKMSLKLWIAVFMILANAVYAETPREQLKQMVEQLQNGPYEEGLREKIIKLAQGLKPAPVVSEEAMRSFVMGETIFKQAKNIRSAYEAANAFETATNLAPWWGDAYWNRAVARELTGQYVSAKEALRLYLLTNLSVDERRIAQNRIYAIDAQMLLAESNASGGILGFWQNYERKGFKKTDHAYRETFEIQQTGPTYNVRLLTFEEDCTVNVVNANNKSIEFYRQRKTRNDRNPFLYKCMLSGRELHCTNTSEGIFEQELYVKRSVCEIVGDSGLMGFPVLCK